MSFNNPSYILYISLVVVLFVFVVTKYERSYFKWVKTYWNYSRTKRNLIASCLYLISMSLFLVSLLDLRGPEEHIKTSIPDQKTVIIIDTSTSMLAEDIKPNRFIKSIQLARHFVKNSPGHQIAVVLFSDVQKRLIPFTDDIDLLDSRLAALAQVNSVKGGSNIAQAIQEATGYLQSAEENAGIGNILVYTDAEETGDGFNLKLDGSYNLAVVGIGTAQGAQIPIRWKDGSLRGYKESRGEPVISKLDENYIKSLGKNVKNYHYWIANSYSLPTTEITDFFNSELEKKLSEGDSTIKMVYSYYILIPAIILYALSVLFSRFASLRMMSVIVCCLLMGFSANKSMAQESETLNPLVIKKLNELKKGKFTAKEALKAGQYFLEINDYKRAAELYSEFLKNESSEEEKVNAVSSFLLAQRHNEGLKLAQNLLNSNELSEKNKNILRSNIVLIFSTGGKGQSQGSDKNNEQNDSQDKKEENQQNESEKGNEEKKENQENKDDKNGKDGKEGQDKKEEQSKKDDKDSKDNNSEQSKSDPNLNKPKDDKDQKNKDLTDHTKEKNDKKDQDKDGKKDKADKKDGGGEKKQEPPETWEQKEEEIKKKRKMMKTPAMIKQILNDDRELQKAMMDTSTEAPGSAKKDW